MRNFFADENSTAIPDLCKAQKSDCFSFSNSTDSFSRNGYTEPILWKGAQKMVRKFAGMVFAVVLVLSLGMQAGAVEDGGSIGISLNLGELPAINGSLTLYQVGIPVTDGYRIVEGFGGGIVKTEDAQSPHLANWLAEGAGEAGVRIPVDVDGNTVFSGLEEGLYMVVQQERIDGFHVIEPLLVGLNRDGNWNVQINLAPEPIIAENPQTGQPVAPLLGAMGMVASGVGLYLCADSKRRK